YTSTVAPAYPLWAGAVLGGINSMISNAVVSGSLSTSKAPTMVSVLAPAAPTVLAPGASYNITWSLMSSSADSITAQDQSAPTIDILFSIDDGQTWQPIAQDLPMTTTHYSWVVPEVKTRNALIRVVSSGTLGPIGSGLSGVFKIKKPASTPG